MSKSAHINNLLIYLETFSKVSKGLKHFIIERATYKSLEKSEVFIRKGAYGKRVAFLSNGIMRIYDIDKNGQHWNKSLLTYQTILLGNTEFKSPSIHNIDAITPCELVELPISAVEEALTSFPELREIREKIISKIYQMKSERESDLLLLSSKERYLKLIDDLADSLELIPQYHIASYLGITPIQLSRIKSTL